jgi:hypothetical protein
VDKEQYAILPQAHIYYILIKITISMKFMQKVLTILYTLQNTKKLEIKWCPPRNLLKPIWMDTLNLNDLVGKNSPIVAEN